MANEKMTEVVGIEELIQDDHNMNKGTEAGKALMRKSFTEFGAGRSILIDRDGRIIAGNKSTVAAGEAGIKRVRVIETDGSELIAVKRTDITLDSREGRELALADNATVAANLSWDETELATMSEEFGFELPEWGVELKDLGIEDDGSAFFNRENRNDDSREEGNDEYNEFLEKFEAKKTTDDCYTPQPVYDAVVEWVEKEYGVRREDFVRPFYPGGDYQKFKYKKGSVVVDNPPFSILSEIIRFYMERGQKFVLFAPSVSTFSEASSTCCGLCVGANVTYENKATVKTSFVTNLEDESIRVRTAPDLYKLLEEANDKFLDTIRTPLPKYTYPDNVITAAFMSKLSKYGQDLRITKAESVKIGTLDSQKEQNNAGIYGDGYLIGTKAAAEKAAAEKAAAEKAAAEKAAAEKAAATRWQLSDREKQIIAELDKRSGGK